MSKPKLAWQVSGLLGLQTDPSWVGLHLQDVRLSVVYMLLSAHGRSGLVPQQSKWKRMRVAWYFIDLPRGQLFVQLLRGIESW